MTRTEKHKKESFLLLVEAFLPLGFSEPLAHPAFQDVVLPRAADPLNGTWSGAMERAIQDCQRRTVKVLHKFYEQKHRLEAELRKAKRANRLQLEFPNWARFRSATRRNKWIDN